MSDERPGSGGEPELSWIFDLRQRLRELDPEAPQSRTEENAEDAEPVVGALFVGLFVEQGQLQVALVERQTPAASPTDETEAAPRWVDLPSRMVPAHRKAWTGAARAARDLLGVDPSAVLEIGTLAPLVDPSHPDEAGVIVPCVGAIPWPIPEPEEGENRGAFSRTVFGLPILAYVGPKGVHQEVVQDRGVARRVLAYDIQGRRLGGLTAAVLDDLASRLGLGN